MIVQILAALLTLSPGSGAVPNRDEMIEVEIDAVYAFPATLPAACKAVPKQGKEPNSRVHCTDNGTMALTMKASGQPASCTVTVLHGVLGGPMRVRLGLNDACTIKKLAKTLVTIGPK